MVRAGGEAVSDRFFDLFLVLLGWILAGWFGPAELRRWLGLDRQPIYLPTPDVARARQRFPAIPIETDEQLVRFRRVGQIETDLADGWTPVLERKRELRFVELNPIRIESVLMVKATKKPSA